MLSTTIHNLKTVSSQIFHLAPRQPYLGIPTSLTMRITVTLDPTLFKAVQKKAQALLMTPQEFLKFLAREELFPNKVLPKKKRRKKGDKSKNARMATLVVMYTLESTTDENGHPKLLGPRNVRIHSSFAPKKYAFAIARREAIKRGFGPSSGKLIQFVYDGDDDLEVYRSEYFGDYSEDRVITTADLPHVLEYLWTAGTSFHKEGSGELYVWVKKQKNRLLQSRADLICKDLNQALNQIPKKGPGNKGKRKRIEDALRYINNNANRLDYKRVASMDLELASGMVEGAVKNIIGLRFDHGGMRWITQRAEALLQLRCIEINGEWDSFMKWLDEHISRTTNNRSCYKLRRKTPSNLPIVQQPCAERVYVSKSKKVA